MQCMLHKSHTKSILFRKKKPRSAAAGRPVICAAGKHAKSSHLPQKERIAVGRNPVVKEAPVIRTSSETPVRKSSQ